MRVGFIVNPVAGIGGAVALKGSDGLDVQTEALTRGAVPQAQVRGTAFLQHLITQYPFAAGRLDWFTWAGPMGAHILESCGWDTTVCGGEHGVTTGTDTRAAAKALLARGIDCLVFVGGDGTARDLLAVVADTVPVIGVPAGVKMHSGVFAVTPRTAAMMLGMLLGGELVARTLGEVRDYDAEPSDAAEIRVRTYGELCVPQAGGYLQQTKVGGKESEPLVLQEICASMVESLPGARNIVLGPGSTCMAVKRELGLAGTLRGCDALLADGEMICDASASQLEQLQQPLLIVSFTRHQGFLFGRGNQQLSAGFLSGLNWPADVFVIASRTKLLTLEQRPLLLDTGDDALDDRLRGLVEIITGYEDSLLYRLAAEC